MSEIRHGNRPLSPHLQIYRPMLTMMLSIVHRITGMIAYGGMALLVWWLLSAAVGGSYFDLVGGLAGSGPGRVVLLGLTWALIHHTLGGVRHLAWDLGYGFGLGTIEITARATLIGSLVLTILTWIVAYALR